MTPLSHLEPATRDPRQLRRTAWILVAIMVVGGWLVLKSYEQFAEKKSVDDRPAFVGRLSDNPDKDLRIILQDGGGSGLQALSGKITAIHAVAAGQPESDRAAGVLRRLSAYYADQPDVSFVSLVINPPAGDAAVPSLGETAEAIGAALPKWWVATTPDPGVLRKFVKKEFKASIMPHQVDGKWNYDPSIVLVDRNRHIRKAVVPQVRGGPQYTANFDFEQAAEWDARKVLTGTERTNVEELEVLLIKTIDQLLAEKPENP
jgi:hypothetical protein